MTVDERFWNDQVASAVAGDGDALQYLILRYDQSLRRRIGHRLRDAGQWRIDPDDVLQDAYIAANRAISGCAFEGVRPFYRWLEKIADNMLRNHMRYSRRRREEISVGAGAADSRSEELITLWATVPLAVASPSRMLARQEAVSAVISSLARLGDNQRTVVRKRFLEGRSVQDIARDMNCSTDAVHKLSMRALRKLRSFFAVATTLFVDL